MASKDLFESLAKWIYNDKREWLCKPSAPSPYEEQGCNTEPWRLYLRDSWRATVPRCSTPVLPLKLGLELYWSAWTCRKLGEMSQTALVFAKDHHQTTVTFYDDEINEESLEKVKKFLTAEFDNIIKTSV